MISFSDLENESAVALPFRNEMCVINTSNCGLQHVVPTTPCDHPNVDHNMNMNQHQNDGDHDHDDHRVNNDDDDARAADRCRHDR